MQGTNQPQLFGEGNAPRKRRHKKALWRIWLFDPLREQWTTDGSLWDAKGAERFIAGLAVTLRLQGVVRLPENEEPYGPPRDTEHGLRVDVRNRQASTDQAGTVGHEPGRV